MSVTSANVNDLATFVTGSQERVDRLTSTLSTTVTKANTVMPLCSGSQYPSTPSLAAVGDLLGTWLDNQGFVTVVHDELVAADQFDGNGMATVADTAVDAALKAQGLDDAPDLVDVDAIELYGQPPYSGFVDDPICLANGNLLLREGDIQLFGVAAALSVVRTYNSRDRRAGVFGAGWSSVLDVTLDVGLALEERRATFRGPDGAGATFHAREDGTWVGGGRRRLSLVGTVAGWGVAEGHACTWRFDAEGALQGFTAGGADVVVERGPDTVRCTDRTSGRWVTYRLEGPGGPVTAAVTSDGRTATYDHDSVGRLVGVHRDRGDVTYELDDRGLLAGVVDADGIVVCRNRYDAAGRVLSQVENHGRETSYEYRSDGVSTVTASDGAPPNVMVHDRRGRLTAMIDGLGNAMRVAYDDHDDVVQIVERTGAVTRFSYDERGNLLERVDPDGLSETFAWDDADRLVARTGRAGGTTRYVYEGRRVPVRVVQADGSEVHATYDDLDLVSSIVDADGVSARIERDRDGLVTAVTDGLGARIAFRYDAAGRSLGIEAPDGIAASVDLDGAGRVLALRTADGERLFDYSPAGRMRGGRRATGAPWQVTLDEAGDVAALADAVGPLVAYERDTVGRVVASFAPGGGSARFEYDPVGRRVAATDPEGHRTETGYDPEGRPLQVTDPSGHDWSRDLDVLGRTSLAVRPDGATTIRSYHPNGELATLTDPAGNQWSYEVDAMGRVVASTGPMGATTTYRYTPGGRLAEVRSPLGRTLRRHYDAAGRLARIVEPDGTEVLFERRADGATSRITRDGVATSFDYDRSGRGSAISGPGGHIRADRVAGEVTRLAGHGAAATFEHDPRGLLRRVVDPAGVVTELTHDQAGRLIAHTTGGSSVSFDRDDAGRLTAVTDPDGNRTSFGRDRGGAVDRIGRPDGTVTLRTFGPDGRLASAHDDDGNELVVLRRDDNGRVVGATGIDRSALWARRDVLGRTTEVGTDAGTVRYGWDADGYLLTVADDSGHRVTFERSPDGRLGGFGLADGRHVQLPVEPELERRLERDADGRIVLDEHGRRYGYDIAGRLAETVVDGATTTYGYDDRGLLATERAAGGVRTHRYGPSGEPTVQVRADGVEVGFEHDATGRRTREVSSDGSRVTYGWDALGRLVTVTRVERSGRRSEHRIEHDPAGRPVRVDGVAILWDSAATGSLLGIGDQRYLHWGRHVCVATDPDDRWDRRVDGDPWGDDGRTGLRLGYRGELALDNLLFLGARVYDTRSRTFLSRDPLPPVPGMPTFGGVYSYAWNDPVNLVDPSGRRPLSDDEYTAWREANTKGFFREMAESIVEDPWGFVAKAAIVVGGVVVMAVATATLGPVGVIVAGAVVGALSGGLNAAIDGGGWSDIGRAALIGGVFGAVSGGMTRFIPSSTAATFGQRALANTGLSAAQEYPLSFGEEAAQSYLPGGDGRMDWDQAFLDGTMGTVAGVGGGEIEHQLDFDHTFDDLGGALDGETPSSLLPDPARNTVLDVNSVSAADLQRIDGIGPVLSQRIIEHRDALGGFTSTQQLLDVPGIGPQRLEAIVDAGGIAG